MKTRLLSLLLVLCMVLSMVPMAAFAEEETITLYFNNTGEWTAVYAYFGFDDSTHLTHWPGEQMTLVEGSIWSIQVPAEAENIIFNSGSGTQTGDLVIPSDGKNLYTYDSNWSVYAETEPEAETVTVYFGNTENWEAVYACFWNEDDAGLNTRPGLSTNPFGGADAEDIVMGERMAFVDDNIWSIEVPADTNRIIFSNGGIAQTGELTLPTDGRNLYTYGSKWSVYGETEPAECTHENTKIVCNDNETHSFICTADDCGKVVKTEDCTIDDATGRCECGRTAMKILVQPVDDCVAIGEAYQVSVTAEGKGLKYQWYLCNEGDEAWYASAERSRFYKGTMTNARANRQVYCVITDAYGNQLTSEIAKLNLKATELKILQQPKDDEAANGESVQTTVKAQGDGLTYQWYLKNVGATQWSLSAVKSATYKATMGDKIAGRQLYCVITDKYSNSVTSEVATLVRTPTALKILTQPVNDEAALKETYDVFVVAEGDGLKYQWYLQNDGDPNWYESAVKTKNYRGTMTKARANRKVYCIITDVYGNTVTSDTVTISCPES